jgi:lipopolysaccharide transport protein LptA
MLARGGVAMNQKADRATSDTLEYDAAKDLAILRGHVVLASANERRATSAVAEFDRRADTVLLKGDVVVTQGKNVMKGERLVSDRKSGKTRLESPPEGGQPAGRIAATFYRPDPKPGETAKVSAAGASPAAVPGAMLLGNSFRTDPSAPIDVGADTLDIVDQTRQAIFRGNVVANQGGFVLRAVEVTALYSGQPGIGFDAAGGKADAGQGAQLTKIEARQKGIVSSTDGRTATGDWADFNVKANTAVIGGKVIVSEGKSVVEGTRLFIDMNTGQSRFENADGQAAAQSSTTCPPGGVCPKGRIRAVFYPKEVEGAAKKGEAKRAEQQLVAPQGSPGPKQPAASSWRATTRGPGAE